MENMKILIAPLITREKADAQFYLTRNLIDLFLTNGHSCLVSADTANGFRNASLYPMPKLRSLLLASKGRSYEEWLYACGAGKEDWIATDTDSLLGAADEYQPDVILTMDRVSALIAARVRNIPCCAFVNSAVFRSTSFPIRAMKGTNAVLSRYHLEQEFSMKDVYRRSTYRIAFGPRELQPFPDESEITRIGTAALRQKQPEKTNRVVIYLSEAGKPAWSLHKIIREAFLGAPYAVYAWYPGVHPEKEANLHFIERPRAELIAGSAVCIHSGNYYLSNHCATYGIPQLVICDRSYPRLYCGQNVQRSGCGIWLYEDELSMSSLYEAYRRLLADDGLPDRVQDIQKKITGLGDLSELLKLF